MSMGENHPIHLHHYAIASIIAVPNAYECRHAFHGLLPVHQVYLSNPTLHTPQFRSRYVNLGRHSFSLMASCGGPRYPLGWLEASHIGSLSQVGWVNAGQQTLSHTRRDYLSDFLHILRRFVYDLIKGLSYSPQCSLSFSNVMDKCCTSFHLAF